MKAHIFGTIFIMSKSSEYMLASVLLHIVKTMLPIDDTVDFFTYQKAMVAVVIDDIVFDLNIENLMAIKQADIAGLASLLREKQSVVQHYLICLLTVARHFLAGNNLSNKVLCESIRIVKSYSFHKSPNLLTFSKQHVSVDFLVEGIPKLISA